MVDFYKLKDMIFHNNKNFIDIHIHVFEKLLIPWISNCPQCFNMKKLPWFLYMGRYLDIEAK
jgi:hypothetical protein